MNSWIKELVLKLFFCRKSYTVKRKRLQVDEGAANSEISCIEEYNNCANGKKAKASASRANKNYIYSKDDIMNGSKRGLRKNNSRTSIKQSNRIYNKINSTKYNVKVEQARSSLDNENNSSKTSKKVNNTSSESNNQNKIELKNNYNKGSSNINNHLISISDEQESASVFSTDHKKYSEISNDKNFRKVSLHDKTSSDSVATVKTEKSMHDVSETYGFNEEIYNQSSFFTDSKISIREEAPCLALNANDIGNVSDELAGLLLEDVPLTEPMALEQQVDFTFYKDGEYVEELSLETFLLKDKYESESIEEETEVSCSVNFFDKKKFNKELSKKLLEILQKGKNKSNRK